VNIKQENGIALLNTVFQYSVLVCGG